MADDARTPATSDDAASEVPEGAVVVGLSDSSHDDTTLMVAADVAARYDAPLHLVSALDVATHAIGIADAGAGTVVSILEDTAASAVERAKTWVHEHHPGLRLSSDTPISGVQNALVDASANARVLVVGAGGAAPGERSLAPTALGVAMHADCPVLVVHGPGVRTGPVVVGVDGSEHSRLALDAAARSAMTRHVPLVVLATWWLEVEGGIVVTDVDSDKGRAVTARVSDLVERALVPVRERYPDVAVEVRIEREQAHRALVRASEKASLLVVGSRGRGGFRGLLLGSVSQRVLAAATGPVLIVRPRAYDERHSA